MFSLFKNDSGLTQKQRVLKMLQNNTEVSALEFTKSGILQYNARIHELRRDGYNITLRSEFVKKGKRLVNYTYYSLK